MIIFVLRVSNNLDVYEWDYYVLCDLFLLVRNVRFMCFFSNVLFFGDYYNYHYFCLPAISKAY